MSGKKFNNYCFDQKKELYMLFENTLQAAKAVVITS